MKFRLYDIRSFRFLFVFDFVFLVIITSCGIAFPPFLNIGTYIFGSLLLISILTQVGIYLFPRGYVLFSEKGIEFISRKVTTQVLWKDVGELIYNDLSYIVILKQNTMEFWYKEGDLMIQIEKNFYPIKISKKKFTQLCEYKQKHYTCIN